MDIIKLNPVTFQPQDLVENLGSKIWSERYLPFGDFELRSPFIEKTMNFLPEDSLVSHMETRETMVVETHEIEIAEDGTENVLIKGRSFERVLEDRVLQAGVRGTPWLMQQNYTSLDAAAVLIWNAIANTAGKDVTRDTFFGADTKDWIANVGVRRTAFTPQSTTEWWAKKGEVYGLVQDFLSRDGGGIRSNRPRPGGVSGVVSVSGTGVLTTATGDGNAKLYIEVYNGLDRSVNQSSNERLIFNHDNSDFDQAKYLTSIQRLKNVGVIDSTVGNVFVYADDDVDPYLTGRDRKVFYMDGGDVGDQDPVEFISGLVQMGEIELKKRNREFGFDTTISPTTAYKYGSNYYLGDKVTLKGKYGYSANMIVSEYVRIEDQEGDRGFPTLVLST